MASWTPRRVAGRIRRAIGGGSGVRVVAGAGEPVGPDVVRELLAAAAGRGPVIRRWAVLDGVLFADVDDAAAEAVVVVCGELGIRVPVPQGGDSTVSLVLPLGGAGRPTGLVVVRRDGSTAAVSEPGAALSHGDPYHRVWRAFGESLRSLPGGAVLEIGSRERSGNVYRDVVPDHLAYVGVDVKEGPNVDVVADAHDLSRQVGDRRFAAAFSIATFEHLLMPWKCVVELNRVLEPGALLFVGSHQTFPLHEEPWDFWRFSTHGWRGLFNRATGFEVIDAAMGEAASIVAHGSHGGVWGLDAAPAYLSSAVLARKVGETTLEWPVALEDVLAEPYPG